MKAILPPATLGLLGGGQLNRYFVHAAHELAIGSSCSILTRTASPVGQPTRTWSPPMTTRPHCSTWRRPASLSPTEFESVPAAALSTHERHLPVRPGAEAVAVCQDRRMEKAFLAPRLSTCAACRHSCRTRSPAG